LEYSADEPVPPRIDSNAPDYYIPRNTKPSFIIDLSYFFLVMSAITYVLVAGLVLGTQNK
jgi:hypothetical protein